MAANPFGGAGNNAHIARDPASIEDNERAAYEQYILAGDNEAAQMEAIESQVPGSTEYYYLYFLHKLRTGGVKSLSEQDDGRLREFFKKHSGW